MKSYRRILLIDRKFQLTFMLYATGVAVTGIALKSFLQSIREMGFVCTPREDYVGTDAWPFMISAGIALLVFIIQIFVGLIISNRMAGPLYRLKKHMDNLAAGGEIREIHFRDGDFYSELAQSYNAVLRRAAKEIRPPGSS